MSEAMVEKITVPCRCGAKLKAPATAAGRKAKCPKCGAILTVPAPIAAESADDALYDLANQAQLAATEAPPATVCAICRSPMREGAVLCAACGYDTRSGARMKAANGPGAAPARAGGASYAQLQGLKTKVEVKVPAPTGSLVNGAAISAAFALVGALVWFGIAKGTNYESGWIAWGVGIAAGFGMMIGYKGTSVKAGAIAALLAVGGIVLGKVLVFQMVVLPMANHMLSGVMSRLGNDQMLEVYEVKKQLKDMGASGKPSPEQLTAARDIAGKDIARMDAATRRSELAKARAWTSDVRATLGSASDLFFHSMFGAMDIVFIAIAVASAFKVATFGGRAGT